MDYGKLKGYKVYVRWAKLDNRYVARCQELPFCAGFSDKSPVVAVSRCYQALLKRLHYLEHREQDHRELKDT